MKLSTVKYMVKEGISNTYKNKLMSLASLATVIASLLIFGIFLILAINLLYNANFIKSQPEVTVYMRSAVSDLAVEEVELSIKENPLVAEYERKSKEQACHER